MTDFGDADQTVAVDWGRMDAPDRSFGERATRFLTSIPQGINQGLYKGVMALPDLSGIIAQRLGLASGPVPSEAVHEAGRQARADAGVTYTPNIVPENNAERVGLQVGDAVGQTASTVLPASIVAKAATPAVAGFNVATPTYGQTVAQTLAASPGLQTASTAAGNLTTEYTGNPYLGMAASLGVPVAAGAAQRVLHAAPATTGAEAERRALLADAQKEGIPVSFGNITNSPFGRMFESVLSKLPFVGGSQAALNEKGKVAFDKAVINRIPEVKGEGIDAMTAGARDMIGRRIGQTFDNLEGATTVRIDPQFGRDIAKAKAGFSTQLESQMPKDIAAKLDELQSAATTLNKPGVSGVTVDGETYKNIRSKLGGMLSGADGNDKQTIGRMIDALDGAVERSLPKDMVKDWQDARTSWRRFLMVKGATDARHNAQTDVGHIPPGSLAARVGKDKEMERLASIGTSFVGDKTPDSGTAMRNLILTGGPLGAAGYGAIPWWAAAAMAGGGYGTNLALNNPVTRAALIARLNSPQESVLTKGLVATLAAKQAAEDARKSNDTFP